MHFYENLFHETIFHKQDSEASMFGINLNMLDIFELIQKHEKKIQQLCLVSVSGSLSDNYNHYDFAAYHESLPNLPFVRISFRKRIGVENSTKHVITLVGLRSLSAISSTVKYSLNYRLNHMVNQWFGVARGELIKLEPSIYF